MALETDGSVASLNVTALLRRAGRGDRRVVDRLVPLVYDTLRSLAQRALRRERHDHTLSATALAHEAYLKLIGLDRIDWQDRAHFFAMASRAMRRILVDYAVGRNAQKRGGGAARADLDSVTCAIDGRLDDMLAFNEALARLELVSPRAVRILECRVFAGLTIEETATALELSQASVKRHWNAGRAWLNRELSREAPSRG